MFNFRDIDAVLLSELYRVATLATTLQRLRDIRKKGQFARLAKYSEDQGLGDFRDLYKVQEKQKTYSLK